MKKKKNPNLPHVVIKDTAQTYPYVPVAARGGKIKNPKINRETHGARLLKQLKVVQKEAEAIKQEQVAFGVDAGNGIYLQFESEPNFELKFDSLETLRSGIVCIGSPSRYYSPKGNVERLRKNRHW